MASPFPLLTRRVLLAALALVVLRAGAARAEVPAGEEPETPETVGFLLGKFLIEDYQPVQGNKSRLNFVAHAAVETDSAAGFQALLDERRSRVRDQVLMAARLTAPEQLQDPELRRLRRRILLRVRHAMPELPIVDVYFSEFQYFVE